MKIRTLAILLVALPFLVPTLALAGDGDAQAVERHIQVLVHESKALEAEGRHDAAAVLWKRAHELKERLAQRARAQQGVPLTMEQAEKVLHGLEMGIEALKVLRREAELEAVAKVAKGVRERMHEARAAQKAARRDVPRDAHPEIEEAKRRLEIYRLAFHGLREGEKREAMERMERVIHALELGVLGRRDEEAREIRRAAPKVGEQIELLQLAAKMWDGFGHEGKAQTIYGLAKQMAEHAHRKTDRKPRAAAAGEQVERLTRQLREIRAMVERLERELKALGR